MASISLLSFEVLRRHCTILSHCPTETRLLAASRKPGGGHFTGFVGMMLNICHCRLVSRQSRQHPQPLAWTAVNPARLLSCHSETAILCLCLWLASHGPSSSFVRGDDDLRPYDSLDLKVNDGYLLVVRLKLCIHQRYWFSA